VRLAAAFLMLAAGVAAAQNRTISPLASAQQKLTSISDHKAKRGSVIVFTPAEVNAWVAAKIPVAVPQGVRNTYVDLGTDVATASALVDFLKIKNSKGTEAGWVMTRMLEGERPVKVNVRLVSSAGRCTVYLNRVEVSGAHISGSPLQLILDNFFKPLYPDAKINEPFELGYNMERIELRPTGIRVLMNK
jgi:hypothetical protein